MAPLRAGGADPRLELRYPTDHDLVALASCSGDIHDPGFRPFLVPWDERPDGERERGVLQYHWARPGDWSVDAWRLELVCVVDGEVVGSQGAHATSFPLRRTAVTGSWLARRAQGRGLGTEMRAAMLHLLFAGLGADRAETGAFDDNERSLAVTRRLGYQPNGDGIVDSGGERRREVKFVLERSDWERDRRDDVEVVGLEPCRELFGLGGSEPHEVA